MSAARPSVQCNVKSNAGMYQPTHTLRIVLNALVSRRVIFFFAAFFLSIARAEIIGRTELSLTEPGWTLLVTYETKLTFNNGEYTLPLQNKVFQLPGSNGEPKALLMVTSTEGGNRNNVKWTSEICPEPRARYFTQDFGSNKQTRVRECLIVNSAFAPFNFFQPGSEVLKAITEKGIKLFKSGYSLRSVYGANGGTLLRVNLMTNKNFKGLKDIPANAGQLHDVPPELVAWGELLHKTVSNSVSSLGGQFALPAIEFSK
ncbi:MAG: hypothetical protein JWQ21_2817 [Herminiimonas sp.]|nr:hypothetical protein [Herminiimonas sp.]